MASGSSPAEGSSLAETREAGAAMLAETTPGGILAGVATEQAGQVIGRYRLLEPLGQGGFGTVWRAEQVEGVRRQVALKIIKLGMDTKQVIARFEAERQALALMDHPHIARVLDAGATETGRRSSPWSWSTASRSRSTRMAPRCRFDSGWSSSSRSATPCSTPTGRASSTVTSSPATC
jgi:serine/threonine protein kinase